MLLHERVHSGRCDGIRRLSVVVERRTAASTFFKKGKHFVTLCVIAANRHFLEARKKPLARVSRQNYTARGCGNYKGRTDGKELHGARS